MAFVKDHYYQIGKYHFKFLEKDNQFFIIFGKDLEIGVGENIEDCISQCQEFTKTLTSQK